MRFAPLFSLPIAVVLLAGCAAKNNTKTNTTIPAAATSATKAAGESAAVQQLGAEFYVTAQSYITHTNGGDGVRAASDRQTLLGDCDTARQVVPAGSQGKNASYLRTLCGTLGSPVP